MKAIQIKGLNYTYSDGTPALQEIYLDISANKRTVILGANGSGKTTLIYHLNGIFLPQQGELTVTGMPLTKKNLKEIRKRVGLLFDNPDNQLFSTTVYSDVAFGPRNLKLTDDMVKARVQQALQAVGIEDLKNKPPYHLSLGQKKKAAIAGLLAMKPQVLVCDEPFSGLDPVSSEQFMKILDKLHAEGTTLVMTTHDVNMAYAWADEVIIMHRGRVLAHGGVNLLRDRRIMEKASLQIPLLAEVFQGSGFYPHSAAEASQLVKHYLGRAKTGTSSGDI